MKCDLKKQAAEIDRNPQIREAYIDHLKLD